MSDAEISLNCGDPSLQLLEFTAIESLGQPFEYRIVALSPNPDIESKKLIGESAEVKLAMTDGAPRYFNGIVARMATMPPVGRNHAYELTLRPWLWLLSRRADCRIFQDQKVIDIVQAVFADYQGASLEVKLQGTYAPWTYCVQYRETDLNFVNRLLEQEGIYYYFKHVQGRHTMVLVDDPSAHDDCPGCAALPYFPHGESGATIDGESIREWAHAEQIESGGFAHTDYDFERPRTNLSSKFKNPLQYTHGAYEIYDYPGEYVVAAEGDHFARVRLEAQQSRVSVADGLSDAQGLGVGGTFSMSGHPRSDQNRGHLVIASQIHARHHGRETGGGGMAYECAFSAIPQRIPFRPARSAYKPTVQGPQTAVVVGSAGEEIYTDKYGRVKVQFHWDRLGKNDENSSCWLRVSQPMAGKGWGFISIPRIGQEVIVDFLEGDPDQPIVNGRVYNADQMPPYVLPDNMTHTGLRTHSSKGGGSDNFNELRFEDKKGSEYVWFQAEKTYNRLVKEDAFDEVRNDEHETIGRDVIFKIGRDEVGEIGRDRVVKIGGDMHTDVAGDWLINLGKVLGLKAGSDISIDSGANLSAKVGSNTDMKTGQNFALAAGMNAHVKAGMNMVLEAGMQLTIKAGAASIVIGPEGVSITGPLVKLNSGGSPGSGSGASPTAPDAPKAPDEAKKPVDPLA